MLNLCISGYAKGSDLYWGKIAKKYNHDVLHYVFKEFRNIDKTCYVLNESELQEADEYLIKSNEILKRRIPYDNYVKNLLRRNFHQIKYTTKIYAISTKEKNSNICKGGTAWAVSMGIILNVPEIYLFDQEECTWNIYDNHWKVIEKPPIPENIYTGIGTRELNENGINAIENCFIL